MLGRIVFHVIIIYWALCVLRKHVPERVNSLSTIHVMETDPVSIQINISGIISSIIVYSTQVISFSLMQYLR